MFHKHKGEYYCLKAKSMGICIKNLEEEFSHENLMLIHFKVKQFYPVRIENLSLEKVSRESINERIKNILDQNSQDEELGVIPYGEFSPD